MDLLYCFPISVLYFNSVFRFCVATMVIRLTRFNSYLLGGLLAVALMGCETTKSKAEKEAAMIRVHIEVNRNDPGQNEVASVSRTAPIELTVKKAPFLDEAQLTQASLVDSHGGFSLALQFDQRGTWLLEQYTAMNPGRHLVVAAQFGEKLAETRWLAAPLITRRISNGLLTFAPDATREEAEAIARGLNNVAIKSGNQPKPKKEKSKDQ